MVMSNMSRRFAIAFVMSLAASLSGGEMPVGKEFTNSIGMKFVRIKGGTFEMGSGERALPKELTDAKERGGKKVYIPNESGDYDEGPVHKVRISKAFYMGACEVTNRQYEQFDRLHENLRGKVGFSIDSDEAVVFVDWYESKAFCEWLSKKEGLPYRLPTEAEWEYACRAGTETLFHTGDTLPEVYLKNPSNSWYPDPDWGRGREEVVPLHVGKTPANRWGLYDMHGNVEEWCEDWYGPYEGTAQSDPVGRVDGDFKVTRGGSHATFAYYLRSANRMGTVPRDKSWLIGFRVVLGEIPETTPLPMPEPELYRRDVRQEVPPDIAKGPDPSKPYFRGPINYVKIFEGSKGPLFSEHNHCSAVVECPNGDLLATWFTTQTESGREMALAASRLPYGQSEWQAASLFWDTPDRDDPAQALWSDGPGPRGENTIYHFASISVAATWGSLAVAMRTSNDNGVTWTKARMILPEHRRRHQVIESVFRTTAGDIVLACDAKPSGDGGTALHISRDNGLTWADAGGTIAGIHAGVAQLDNGRLIAFGRGDEILDKMPKSVSSDMGRNWDYSASIFPGIGGGQRLVLLKLEEGPLLLVSLATKEVVKVTDASGNKREVKGLFAALSYDGGESWPKVRLVSDDGPGRKVKTTNGKEFTLSWENGEPKGYYSICQGRNGLVHITSSWNHYSFNLKWLETAPPSKPIGE